MSIAPSIHLESPFEEERQANNDNLRRYLVVVEHVATTECPSMASVDSLQETGDKLDELVLRHTPDTLSATKARDRLARAATLATATDLVAYYELYQRLKPNADLEIANARIGRTSREARLKLATAAIAATADDLVHLPSDLLNISQAFRTIRERVRAIGKSAKDQTFAVVTTQAICKELLTTYSASVFDNAKSNEIPVTVMRQNIRLACIALEGFRGRMRYRFNAIFDGADRAMAHLVH